MRLHDFVKQIQEAILEDPKIAGYKVVGLNEFIDVVERINSVKLEVKEETEQVYLQMEF